MIGSKWCTHMSFHSLNGRTAKARYLVEAHASHKSTRSSANCGAHLQLRYYSPVISIDSDAHAD